MSSAASPEETPNDASSDPGYGGSSMQLTQGEIVFATLLSFVVLVAIVLALYTYYIHRKPKQPMDATGTEISCIVDCDANAKDEADNVRGVNGFGRRRSSMESGSTDIRRGSMDDNDGFGNRGGPRRTTTDSIGINGARGNGTESDRRASCSALGPNVSRQYKQAAIEHMNQISQTGNTY